MAKKFYSNRIISDKRVRGLDIDTKRYLNRANGYRRAGGLPDIAMEDAIDIDNFVVGLKDLGVWHNITALLISRLHNTVLNSTVLSIGGFKPFNTNIVGSSSEWTEEGIKFTSVSGNYITSNFRPDVTTTSAAIGGIVKLDSNSLQTQRLITADTPHTSQGLGFDAYGSNALRKLARFGAVFGSTPLTLSLVTVGQGAGTQESFSAINNSHYSNQNLHAMTHPAGTFRIGDAPNGICLGTYFMAWWLNQGMNRVLYDSFYSLCKQSIGRNLNLP